MHHHMTFSDWNDMVLSGELEDISHELPDSFMVFGQILRGRVLWHGIKYDVSGFYGMGVDLIEVKNEKENRHAEDKPTKKQVQQMQRQGWKEMPKHEDR